MGECLIGTGRSGATANINVGTTLYYSIGMTNALLVSATEDQTKANFPYAGVVSQLCMRVGTNTLTSAKTDVRTRINGADGNSLLEISPGVTGFFLDATNIDVIAADDDVDISLVVPGAGSGAMSFTILTVSFTATGEHTTCLAASVEETTSANNQSRFCGFYATNLLTVTATAPEVQIDRAGTMSDLSVYITQNARTTTTTVRSRKNNANGAMAATIGAGLTGWFSDTSNTDTIADNDLVAGVFNMGASSEVIGFSYIGVFFTCPTNQAPIIAGVQGGLARTASATRHFYLPLGATSNNSTGETNQTMQKNFACKVRNMKIFISASTTTGITTMNFRVNAANANQTVSITAATTGIFEDTTNVDVLLGTDDFCFSLVDGTSGSLSFRYMSASMGVPASIRSHGYIF